MKKKCIPDFYYKSIYEIDFDNLKKLGIKNLIIDIDNTLMPWGSKIADENVKDFIISLRNKGFKICLLSNSSRHRVKIFKGDMDIEYFSLGIKPMKIMFKGAMRKLDATPLNTCVIGDQIFTDILGGNRCNTYTILVDPISKKEFITTMMIRRIEKIIKKNLKCEKELK